MLLGVFILLILSNLKHFFFLNIQAHIEGLCMVSPNERKKKFVIGPKIQVGNRNFKLQVQCKKKKKK